MTEKFDIESDLQLILRSEEVCQFLIVVDQLLDLLKTEDIDIIDFVDKSWFNLTELYYRSRFLPKISPKYSTIDDYRPSFAGGYTHTIDKLDSLADYYTVNPYSSENPDDKPLVEKGSLKQDFLLLFFTLNSFMLLLTEGTDKSVEQALVSIKSKFNFFLGIKCLDMIRALNYLRFWILSKKPFQ